MQVTSEQTELSKSSPRQGGTSQELNTSSLSSRFESCLGPDVTLMRASAAVSPAAVLQPSLWGPSVGSSSPGCIVLPRQIGINVHSSGVLKDSGVLKGCNSVTKNGQTILNGILSKNYSVLEEGYNGAVHNDHSVVLEKNFIGVLEKDYSGVLEKNFISVLEKDLEDYSGGDYSNTVNKSCSSVLKKRRKKMNRHKYRKWRKRMRFVRRALKK